ncbi:MAG: Asp-tRNA(Asn)/Glu-tRNA(Gln) amidotransferase subunit GatB [Myxococcota bacterium]|nr:Asp-tRNA(Asn)/Glu-tRNA(Gln) amidotransferase subunit GatB [Myxococcota bacterium]
MGYEVVIGLEVHTHLRTQSKLFSPAPVAYGDEPNHNTHPVDLALPGVLPVLNRSVIELAIRLGLATHSTINERSVFSRKNYFYPDLPKGYQISQFEEPTVSDGWLEIEVASGKGKKKGKKKGGGAEVVQKRIGITRAHLEEDAGKSIHDATHATTDTLVDLNRAGVPLLEIVSEPDLRSAAEASAYLKKLRAILRYIGVSDADMEKGQFRCDANVSLRRPGAELGTRTEIKNLNSFAFVEAAINAEVERQAEVLDDGDEVVQATMAFDPATGHTSVMRLKENADDYRYFDDPDLVPLMISEADIEAVQAQLPELPDDKRDRFVAEYALSESDATTLTQSRALAQFFEDATVIHAQPKSVANWILRDVLQSLGEGDRSIEDLALTPESFAALVALVDSGRLTAKSGREIYGVLAESGGDPEAIMAERGLESVQDTGLIEGVAREVIASNPDSVDKYREGDGKVLNFLMGQVMKATQGKANPADVKQILERELAAQ